MRYALTLAALLLASPAVAGDPAASERIGLQVVASPSGATVKIDGVPVVSAPVRLSDAFPASAPARLSDAFPPPASPKGALYQFEARRPARDVFILSADEGSTICGPLAILWGDYEMLRLSAGECLPRSKALATGDKK